MDQQEALTEVEQEVYSRWQLAMQLRDKCEWAEATKEYVWLWQNIPLKYPNMSVYGLRTRNLFLFNDMARVVLPNYPQARLEFEKLRDAALEDARKLNNRDDWVALNSMLGHDEDTLSWFDSCKHETNPCQFIQAETRRLEEVLVGNNRLADLVFMYDEPIKRIDELYKDAQQDIWNQGCAPGELPFDLFPEAAEKLYAAYLAAGVWTTADQIAERAMELRAGVIMCLMRAMLNQRCPQPELSLCAELPADADAHLRQGCLECDSGKFEAGLREFDLAVQSSKEISSIAIAHRGAARLLCHQIAEGIQDLTSAIELNPDNAFACRWRGWGFARRFQFDAAVHDFARAIELDSEDAFAYCGRGRVLFKQEKMSAAILDCDESIRCNATNSEAYFARAVCYDATGDCVQSLSDLDQSLKLREALNPIDKRDSECLRDSSAFGFRSIIDEISKYDLYIRVESPNLDGNYIKRAKCEVKLNKIDAAMIDLEAAQALCPNDPRIVLEKVNALLRIGKLSEAVAAATNAIEKDPQQAAGYLARADARRKAGEYDLVLADLSKAIDLGGELAARAYFNRARAHEKLGHADAASKDAQTAATMGYKGE